VDTGLTNSLLQASNFVESIEERQRIEDRMLEEISFRKKYIFKKSAFWNSKNHWRKPVREISNEDCAGKNLTGKLQS